MALKTLILACWMAVAGAWPLFKSRSESQDVQPAFTAGHWIDTWTAMPQLTEYTNLPPPPFNQSGLVFANSTIRQSLAVSLGADQIRIRISNEYGSDWLNITAVTVAYPGGNGSLGLSEIQTDSLQTVTFSGDAAITIPDGALVVSDPLNFKVGTGSYMVITMYLATGQRSNLISSHPGSRVTSWFTYGNQVNAANITGSIVNNTAHWYFISAVEAWAPMEQRTWAIVGDSITDGRGSDTNKNNRWPDLVFAKMQQNPSTNSIAYANVAAGGNRLLDDGNGPNAVARITHDVLAQSGVRYAMVFEGVNDIGTADNTTAAQQNIGDEIIWAYKQMITRVHTLGMPMFASTITPFGAPNDTIQPYSDPVRLATRRGVNDWIRTSGAFDAVVDFDAVVRDPNDPDTLNPIYNSGDFLHPNVMGYQAIADAFPLDIFDKFAAGVNGWSK